MAVAAIYTVEPFVANQKTWFVCWHQATSERKTNGLAPKTSVSGRA